MFHPWNFCRFGGEARVLNAALTFPETHAEKFVLWISSRNTAVLLTPFPLVFVPVKTLLEAKQNELHERNLKTSLDRCSSLLQVIFEPLEEEVKQGFYSIPGGHRLFMQRREELKAVYYQVPWKGLQVHLVYALIRGHCWGSSSRNQRSQIGRSAGGVNWTTAVITRLPYQSSTCLAAKGLVFFFGYTG